MSCQGQRLRGQSAGWQVLEVVAETEAPKLDYAELLELHPTEVSQEERVRQREAEEEAQARFEAVQEEVSASLIPSRQSSMTHQLKQQMEKKCVGLPIVHKRCITLQCRRRSHSMTMGEHGEGLFALTQHRRGQLHCSCGDTCASSMAQGCLPLPLVIQLMGSAHLVAGGGSGGACRGPAPGGGAAGAAARQAGRHPRGRAERGACAEGGTARGGRGGC